MSVLDPETRNFLYACRTVDLELVRSSLARGADVRSGLRLAARGGIDDGDLLDLLLAQLGTDVNFKDEDDTTPLMEACIWGSENSVKKLLNVVGIKINCQDYMGQTALHLALKNDNAGCFQILAEVSGLDWNLEDDYGDTPLIKAAANGCAVILEIILRVPEPQVDFTVTDNYGHNVAWCAVLAAGSVVREMEAKEYEDSKRCIELLTADPRVDWNWDPAGGTPLFYGLMELDLELAKIIIKNPSVDLNVQNDAGKFPETIARLILMIVITVVNYLLYIVL